MPITNKVTITHNDGTTEELSGVVQYNFFGNYIVFDMLENKKYIVRGLEGIDSYHTEQELPPPNRKSRRNVKRK